MIRERSEVDKRYEVFLKKRKKGLFNTMTPADYQAVYESCYGAPESLIEWDRVNSMYRERYEREHGNR